MRYISIGVALIVIIACTSYTSYYDGYDAGLTVLRKPTFRERIFHANSIWACKHTHMAGVKCYKYDGDTK